MALPWGLFFLVFQHQNLQDSYNFLSWNGADGYPVSSILLVLGVECGFLISVFFLSVVVEMLQIGLNWNIALLKLDFGRINPVRGLRRILGIPENELPWSFFDSPIFEALRWVALLAAIGIALSFLGVPLFRLIVSGEGELNSLLIPPLLMAFGIMITLFPVCLLLLAVARLQQRKRLLMDREELKRELRESEGNEESRQRRGEAYAEIAHGALIHSVRKAKLVVKR
jgi:flagellar biosynthesis protein FlhB